MGSWARTRDRRDAILRLIEEVGPLRLSAVGDALAARGYAVGDTSLVADLKALKAEGKIDSTMVGRNLIWTSTR